MGSYILTFTEGILAFISPCILPMLPIYFIYLAGTSERKSGATAENSSIDGQKHRTLLNSAGFVIGFTLVFVALGAAASLLGGFLKENRLLLQKISGLVMILFGLNFTGLIKLGFLNTEKRIHLSIDRLNFGKSILFGTVFGLGWSPCQGYLLGSALILAGNAGTVTEGILLLLVYSIGLGIPFLISSAIFESVKGAFTWLNRHGRAISVVSGMLLVVAGLLIFFDILRYL